MLPGIRYSVASNRQRYSTNRLKRSRNKVHPPHDLVIWRCPCSGWMYPESLVMCLSSFFPQGLPPKFPGWSLWFAHEISVISWRPTARKPHWLMGLRPWGLFFLDLSCAGNHYPPARTNPPVRSGPCNSLALRSPFEWLAVVTRGQNVTDHVQTKSGWYPLVMSK